VERVELEAASMTLDIMPSVFWIYGLSGSGKSTLSSCVAARLRKEGLPCLVLDGDEMRAGLCRDLGFTSHDRSENIRRAAEVAKSASRQGFIVLAAFITPEASMRQTARRIVEPTPFYEIFLRCDYATCANRDTKGLYARAARGEIENFSGMDGSFEVPLSSDLLIDTQNHSAEQSVSGILDFIRQAAGEFSRLF
jgi:adenylyl-sulfate kinase